MTEDFEPLHIVYLPLEAQGKIQALENTNAKIVLSLFSSHRIVLETEANAPVMVTVAQTFYHPWQAYVDGVPAKLWRANYAFQAFEVPGGRHQAVLLYEDALFRYGAIVSGLFIIGSAIGWFLVPKFFK